MIRDFENWEAALGEVSSLEELRGTRVAMEAAHYLNTRILNNPAFSQPLLPALGGLPLGLMEVVARDLDSFAALDIELLFVFSGIDLAKPEGPFLQRQQGASVNADAWALYDRHDAEQSVIRFGQSKYVTPEDLFGALQAILVGRHMNLLVAPYSAWAQMVHLEKDETVAAIAGASELLLFPCDKVITSFDFDNTQFRWIRRGKCIADLRKFVGNGIDVTDDMFVDACLLAGSHFLPTLPNLATPQRNKIPKPHAALEMMLTAGRTGISVVQGNADDPKLKEMEYLEKYRKARMAVKHNPILSPDGKILPSNQHVMPEDSHEFIGPLLPGEVYHYLSRGLINARILSWRATSEIIQPPPVDGGDSTAYHKLVSSTLIPLRTTAINLLSSSLHNWYQHKDLTLKCWFVDNVQKSHTSTISMKSLPDTRRPVEMWNVREATFKDAVSQFKWHGYLGSAVLSLKNEDFVAKSSSKKDVNNPLSTEQEIVYNSIWRFLALREYVDVNHSLTAWGKMLATVIAALKGRAELEEPAMLAVELIRLGVLNGDSDMFPTYNGAPMRGDDADRTFNLLISRVAGLGTLHHKPIGFTGPLSQHLLAYNSVIDAVRSSVRDLVEVSATNMFMTGFVKRDIDNIPSIAIHLPFLLPNNCALSIAVKSYLDELVSKPDPTSAETKKSVQDTASTRYFPQSIDLAADMKTAFFLWDSVYEGVKSSGNLVNENQKKLWGEANEWLAARR